MMDLVYLELPIDKDFLVSALSRLERDTLIQLIVDVDLMYGDTDFTEELIRKMQETLEEENDA